MRAFCPIVKVLFFLFILRPSAVAQKIRCAESCAVTADKCNSRECCGCSECDQPCGAEWELETQLAVAAKLYHIWDAPKVTYEELAAPGEPCDSSCSSDPTSWHLKCQTTGCSACGPCRNYQECYNGFPEVEGQTTVPCLGGDTGTVSPTLGTDSVPRAAMFVRLAFHDCIPYEDGTGGCDGCLKFNDMFRRYNDNAMDDKRGLVRKDPVVGSHNGLAVAADVLEGIYVNPSYPNKAAELPKSLKDMGISRADLWAFAGQVASDYSMQMNNIYCRGQDEKCDHLYTVIGEEDQCLIGPRSIDFVSGRRDCSNSDKPVPDPVTNKVKTMELELPEGHRYRAYETLRAEVAPNPSGNGAHLFHFFSTYFGLSVSETIALMGAHSLGKLRGDVSLWKYQWQRSQTELLNNNYYRMLLELPSKYQNCASSSKEKGDKPRRAVGGPNGQLAETGFFVRPIRKCESAGPYLWFHYYKRCPDCYKDDSGNWVNSEDRGSAHFKSVACCACSELRQDDPNFDPTCVESVTHDEVMIPVDMGVLYDFQDDKYGVPMGCPGFGDNWNRDNIVEQATGEANHKISFYTTEPKCPMSMNRKELVDLYAHEQDVWVEDFIKAFQKMQANGYQGTEFLKTQPESALGVEQFSCKKVNRKLTCTM